MDGLPADLIYAHFADIKIQAFRHPLVSFNGGIVFDDKVENRRLRHTQYWKPADTFIEGIEFSNFVDGDYVYAGPVYHHFGHVMAEMVHRILPARRRFECKKWLFVAAINGPQRGFSDFPNFYREILEYVGVKPSDVCVVNQDSIIKGLSVCEQGSDLGGGAKPGYLEELAEYSSRHLLPLYEQEDSPEKIYVSRSGMLRGGNFLGEAYFENLLAAEGFCIIAPENLPFTRQMNLYKKSKVVIFPEGSACHGVELLGNDALQECHFLARRHTHQKIFRQILAPRSVDFSAVDNNFLLGTVVKNQNTGQPLVHLGVSMFNVGNILEFYKYRLPAVFQKFSVSHYLDAAKQDLLSYLSYQAIRAPESFNSDAVQPLLVEFDKACTAILS